MGGVIRENFTLKPVVPLRKRFKRRMGTLRRRWSELKSKVNRTIPKLTPPNKEILFLVGSTHILLFYFIRLQWIMLSPVTFMDRLLTLTSSVGVYGLSQYIILKAFESYRIRE